MPSKLRTDWKRIGRSGPTIDGRNIDAEALVQAAKNYDPQMYTALMWPEHERWYNMGKIEALRAENNDEGGVDLFAIIAPNEYYEQANKYGQKLFTSMELKPNFRDSGEYYLTGCAATDNPASTATSEIRFSASNNDNELLLAKHQEFTTHTFDDQESADDKFFSRLAKFFKSDDSEEDDMSKEQLEALQERFEALEARLDTFTAGKPTEQAESDSDDNADDKFAALEQSVQALTEKFEALESPTADDKSTDEFNALKGEVVELKQQLADALKEQPGTDTDDFTGGGDDDTTCVL